MALNFYLGAKDNDHIIHIDTNATFTESISSFDNGTFDIEWNDSKNAIAPQTKFIIEDTSNNDIWNFVIISDNVEVVSKINQKYVHHLVVSQSTNRLTKHLLRNSVFSQPFTPKEKAKTTFSGFINLHRIDNNNMSWINGNMTPNQIYTKANDISDFNSKVVANKTSINLTTRNKISRAYIEIETFMQLNKGVDFKNDVWFDADIGSPDSWIRNNHHTISLNIKKEVNGTVVATKTINFSDYETKIELDVSDSFFSISGNTIFYVDPIVNGASFNQIDIPANAFDIRLYHGIAVDNIPMIFTNINAVLHLETYYYSLYDVLDIIRKQYAKDYNGSANEKIYELPNYGNIYDTLKNTIAPDLTFNGLDIYSCVNQVMSYIDAIPTLDENNTLGFIYLNQQNKTPTINLQIADIKTSIEQTNYVNKLTNTYQNARQDNSIFYPAKYIYRRVSTKNYGVPKKGDYVLETDKPIDYLNKVKLNLTPSVNAILLKLDNDGVSRYWTKYKYGVNFPENTIDVSDSIYESSITNYLDEGDVDSIIDNKQNTISYSKGAKQISLSIVNDLGVEKEVYKSMIQKVFGKWLGFNFDDVIYQVSSGSGGTSAVYGYQTGVNNFSVGLLKNLQYNIEYHAIFDGKVQQESTENKYEGEMFVSQQNSNVSLNRMGNTMQGLIAKLGTELKKFVLPVSNYGSRFKVGSLWVDDDGNKFIANVVKTTFSTKSQSVIVECEFTKNFNMISQYAVIDQEKRFYEISEKLTSKGYENIDEFIYISTQDRMLDAEYVALQYNAFATIIDTLLTSSFAGFGIDFATIDTYENENENVKATEKIYVPFHSYGFGNSICFEIGFDNSINAGSRLTGSSSLNTKSTLYTADSGFADMVNITFYNYEGQDIYAEQDFPDMHEFFENVDEGYLFESIKINKLKYYKKPNEIFHLNYAVAFMPYPNEEIFIGDRFINDNAIIRNNFYEGIARKFYMYISYSELYSIIDNNAFGDEHFEVETVITKTHTAIANGEKSTADIRFVPKVARTFSCVSWCIADENGKVLLACNQELTNESETQLYFITRKHRKVI